MPRPPAATRVPSISANEDEDQGSRPLYLSEGSIWPGSQSTVRDHMITRVATVQPNMTLKQAATLMRDKVVSGLPVVDDDGRILGVISRSDLLRVISEGRAQEDVVESLLDIEASPVIESMTKKVVTISPDATMLEAAQMMYPKRLNRLIVVDDDGQLQGIVTSTDVVLVALCDELSEIDYSDED